MALRIGVIGAGTAGSALALLTARAGHAVSLFEAVPDPGPVGAGIMLQPTGMSVLARLGLLAPVVARGTRVERLHCVTRSRRSVIDLRYGDVHPGTFGLGLHRGVLFEALFGAVSTEKGVELRTGCTIESIDQDHCVDEDGKRHGPFDLIAIADGARSRLRAATGLVRRATEYPWGALWFIGEDRDAHFEPVLFQVVEGTKHMLGLLPSGLGPTGDVPRVSLFWSVRADRVDAWRKAGLEPWKQLLCELEPRARTLLEQVDGVEEVLFARYWDVVLSRLHAGRIVCLGDAAHATSPQLGQGVNLALCDAAVLADCLAEAPDVPRALERYSRERRAHLSYYQWATRWLTPFFQSDFAPFGWLRDAFMGLACKLPYVRRRMIYTMCGIERGILFEPALPLPKLPQLLGPG